MRDDELDELDRHMIDTCPYPVKGGSENPEGKVNILLQTFISKRGVDNFSLVSDMAYVAQVGDPESTSAWLNLYQRKYYL